MDISDLPTPALLIYLERVRSNCQKMIDRATEFGVQLRPHFKTSKTVEAAHMMTGGTKRRLVVSTIPEAELLANNGFDDILFGFPFSPNEDKVKRCTALNERLDSFHVMVDSLDNARMVVEIANASKKPWSVFVFVDCGDHREGLLHDSEEVIEVAKCLNEAQNIKFQGLYNHDGHSYLAGDKTDLHKIGCEVVDRLLSVVDRLKGIGIECKTYGVGSTPTCSMPCDALSKVTEWHPGNYALYDVQQLLLGSCKLDDIACAVATRVIGHYKGEGCNHILVDCGFMALTKQGLDKAPSGGFGLIVDHPELKLAAMTQEVGKVTTVDGNRMCFEKYPVGSMLFILPYHSCATCGMYPFYNVVNGEGKVVDKWTPARGW